MSGKHAMSGVHSYGQSSQGFSSGESAHSEYDQKLVHYNKTTRCIHLPADGS